MASVFNRGSKDNPRWFVRFRDGAGVWRSRRTQQQTRREALAVARQLEAQEERRRLGLEAPAHAALSCRVLMERWAGALANRAARSDQYRIAKHLVPRFGALRIAELTMAAVVLWLDDLASAAVLEASSQRGLLGLLSRFCSWAVDRGFMNANPCRAIPGGRRPHGAPRGGADIPWIADDVTVLRIFERLPEPIRFIWLLTNRAGLRCGEACGLTLGDLDGMAAGAIRVQRNYLSPMLKEARGAPKTKWVPAPSDLEEFLGRWLEQRRAAGAGPEDLVFPRDGRFCFNKDQVGAAFRNVRSELGLPRELTAHRAGRHSFASRLLAGGASVTEVSSALGHADGGRLLMQTYNHFVRRTWSPALVAPMTVPAPPIIPIGAARAPVVPPAPAAGQGDEANSDPMVDGERKAGGDR